MDRMKLVEVPVSELANDSRVFYWAVNGPNGVDFDREPNLKRVHPDAPNDCYSYYQHLEATYGNIQALVWEQV